MLGGIEGGGCGYEGQGLGLVSGINSYDGGYVFPQAWPPLSDARHLSAG